MPARSHVLLLLALAACGAPAGDKPAPDTDTGTDDPGACATDLTAAGVAAGAWDTRFTIAGFAGHDGLAPTVYDFAPDVDGTLLATGRFQWLGSEPIEPLARWRDGAWEPAREVWELVPDLNGFAALAIADDGALALATYDTFGDRDGEIWVDDGTGLRAVGTFTGLVRSLAWFDGRLWVAGNHVMDGDDAIAGLATWDGTTWAAAPGGALTGAAFELTVDGAELLVGGAFTEVGGAAAENVAAWDGATWRALDLPGALAVYALQRGDDGELYAGGALGDITSGAGGISRWDGAAWQTVGGGVAMYGWPGVVTDLAVHEGTLHATGCFDAAGGVADGPDTVPARGLARWDGTTWEGLDDGSEGVLAPWMEAAVCGDEGLTAVWDVSYQRIASAGDTLFVGGSFPGAGGVLSQSIVGHTDAEGFVAQGSDGLGLGGAVERLAAAGTSCDDIYALGTFTHAGGTSVTADLLHFDGDAWEPLVSDIPSDAWCPALAASETSEVAVGCMEFSTSGDAVGRVYRAAGGRLDPVPVDLGPIHALAYDRSGVLWIAGGAITGYLARLDGDALTVVEDAFDAPVTRMDVRADDDVVVGGMFTNVGDVAASRLARWDGAGWSALGEGAPGMVTALARPRADADTVYVSTYDEGNGAWLLGAWDGTTWTELATPAAGLTPQSYFNLNDIQPIDDALLLVGSVELDEGEARGALVYRDGAFTGLGGAVRGINVTDLQLAGDAIWVAGSIAEVGAGDTLAPSVGVARYVVSP